MAVSRQKKEPAVRIYCRRCMEARPERYFSVGVDKVLDSNGYMSICTPCSNEIYDSMYQVFGDFYKALKETCRILNVSYLSQTAEGVEKRTKSLKAKGSKNVLVYSMYRTALGNRGGTYFESDVLDFEPETPHFEDEEEQSTFEELQTTWGKGYEMDTYLWLDAQYKEWSSVHKSDTPAERTLLREIVWKKFEIARARENNEPTGTLAKELQDLMKTSALDPAKAKVTEPRSNQMFSDFITMIEETEPAEVFGKERDAFKDWQNIERYFNDYVVRPIKNFVVGSKDFSVDDVDPEIHDYLAYEDDDE